MTTKQKIAAGLFLISGLHIALFPAAFGITLLVGAGVISACFAGVLLLTDKK